MEWGMILALLGCFFHTVQASQLTVSIVDSIKGDVTPAVNQNLVLSWMYGLPASSGGLVHAVNSLEEAQRLRSLLLLQVQAISETAESTSLFWTGVCFEDGWSNWIYPMNSSWVSHSVKSYRGVATNGYAYEEGPSSPGAVNVSWLGESGNVLYPPISSYQWVCTEAETYVQVKAKGASTWTRKLGGWQYQAQFSFGTPVQTNLSTTIGIAYFGLKVDFIETHIRTYTQNIPGSFAFVIDVEGDLVLSSVLGAAYECATLRSCEQIQGTDCADTTIAAIVGEIQTRNLFLGGSVGDVSFTFENMAVSTSYLSDLGGMPLSVHWLVVTSEPILCKPGYYLDPSSLSCTLCPSPTTSSGGSTVCDLCLEDFFLFGGSCMDCPLNAFCTGGKAMPRPLEGYWVERRKLKFASTMYECTGDSCRGAKGPDDCWAPAAYKNQSKHCKSDTLQCRHGASGPICGSCRRGFYFASFEARCRECSEWWVEAIVPAAGLLLFFLAALVYTGWIEIPECLRNWFAFGVLRHVDSGSTRIVFSTYQILHSISWSRFPSPYSEAIGGLGFLSFDFGSTSCVAGGRYAGPLNSAYMWSAIPLALAGCIIVAYVFKTKLIAAQDSIQTRFELQTNYSYYLILLSYLVLPAVTYKQFRALDCVGIADKKYVRLDTNIDCESTAYYAFESVDVVLILVYLSVPLVWGYLLWLGRDRLNPPKKTINAKKKGEDDDPELAPIRFLYRVYRPECFWWEVNEMLRRIMMVSVLPLITQDTERRAALGVFVALCSLVVYREIQPFKRASANLLAYIAQWTILVTYGAALAINSGIDEGVNEVAFGCSLLGVNLVVVCLASHLAYSRYRADKEKAKEQKLWRRALSTKELEVVRAIMGTEHPGDTSGCGGGEGIELTRIGRSSQSSMNQHLLTPSDIELKQRIGSGSFGEVFQGTYVGEPVAVKTMIDINEDIVNSFRREILLTATLRHPNIVAFVGACWTQELMCLVLEWVPKGTLGDLLADPSSSLSWADPLLRLAMDVARGMVYLHQRDYFDEIEGKFKSCVLHRDLKPDNCLVTDFLSAKLTDFGTSRTKEQDVTLTSIGTPMFCAPEIMNGDAYDEKCDVYSFGLMLLDMAVEEPLLDFIGERFRISSGKSKALRSAMRLIKSMTTDGWRPVTSENPLERAPSTISDLLVRCCSQEPNARPAFSEILDELSTVCKAEVDARKRSVQSRQQRCEVDLLRSNSEVELLENADGITLHEVYPRSDHQWSVKDSPVVSDKTII